MPDAHGSVVDFATADVQPDPSNHRAEGTRRLALLVQQRLQQNRISSLTADNLDGPGPDHHPNYRSDSRWESQRFTKSLHWNRSPGLPPIETPRSDGRTISVRVATGKPGHFRGAAGQSCNRLTRRFNRFPRSADRELVALGAGGRVFKSLQPDHHRFCVMFVRPLAPNMTQNRSASHDSVSRSFVSRIWHRTPRMPRPKRASASSLLGQTQHR